MLALILRKADLGLLRLAKVGQLFTELSALEFKKKSCMFRLRGGVTGAGYNAILLVLLYFKRIALHRDRAAR